MPSDGYLFRYPIKIYVDPAKRHQAIIHPAFIERRGVVG